MRMTLNSRGDGLHRPSGARPGSAPARPAERRSATRRALTDELTGEGRNRLPQVPAFDRMDLDLRRPRPVTFLGSPPPDEEAVVI